MAKPEFQYRVPKVLLKPSTETASLETNTGARPPSGGAVVERHQGRSGRPSKRRNPFGILGFAINLTLVVLTH